MKNNVDGKMTYDTAERWARMNPVLDRGEPGFEIDTFKMKVGDGILDWVSLPYVAGGPGGSTGERKLFKVQYVLETANESAGMPPAAEVWFKRKLNREIYNVIPGASLNASTSEITLPAGKYLVSGEVPFHRCNRSVARLVAGGTVLTMGTLAYSNGSGYSQIASCLDDVFELDASTVITVEQIVQSVHNSINALGINPEITFPAINMHLTFEKIG